MEKETKLKKYTQAIPDKNVGFLQKYDTEQIIEKHSKHKSNGNKTSNDSDLINSIKKYQKFLNKVTCSILPQKLNPHSLSYQAMKEENFSNFRESKNSLKKLKSKEQFDSDEMTKQIPRYINK